MKDLKDTYAIIGAGPSGLAMARNFQKYDIPFLGFEKHSSVGGLWDISNPNSTVYQSAHLISSKSMTEFAEFPMKDEVADYPSHQELCTYFNDFTDHFKLRKHFKFETNVEKITKLNDNCWQLKTENEVYHFKGIVIANGNLSEPNIPSFEGHFSNSIIHSKAYKNPESLKDKRVLVVGAGNSGCDIVIDAVHYAKSVDISVRRGYHFVPKYIFGKPADTIGGKIKIPSAIKQIVDRALLNVLIGKPTRFGFPKPDHKLYESHPIVNSLILHHIGHGDIRVKGDIRKLNNTFVEFKDDTKKEYDLVLLATGYKLHYPFIDEQHLNLKGNTPNLFLNIFPPANEDLYFIGLLEAIGLGWQGRYEQGTLIAKAILAKNKNTTGYQKLKICKLKNNEDLTGGINYLKLDRMAYYVNKDVYLRKMRQYQTMLDS